MDVWEKCFLNTDFYWDLLKSRERLQVYITTVHAKNGQETILHFVSPLWKGLVKCTRVHLNLSC
jgi:hypothetical protein